MPSSYLAGADNLEHKMANDIISSPPDLSGTGDLLTGWGEFALDQALDEGILKDIPLLGSLVKLYKTGENVREYLFSRKVEKFLRNLSKVSDEEVKCFNDSIESDPEFKARVAEHLTLLLDRIDDIEKSELLAKAFSAFIKGQLDFDKFRRIARAIERCMIDDLREVHNFERANDAFPEITYDLAACGLVELASLPLIQAPGANSTYKITVFGELFVKVVLL